MLFQYEFLKSESIFQDLNLKVSLYFEENKAMFYFLGLVQKPQNLFIKTTFQ